MTPSLDEMISYYRQNFNKEPILHKEKFEELAKIMNVEIEDIVLHTHINFEWWHIKVKAKKEFVESVYCNDLSMEIIGVNFDSKELLIEIRPKYYFSFSNLCFTFVLS